MARISCFRRRAWFASLLTIFLFLVACGDSDGEKVVPSPQDQSPTGELADALLVEGDLPPGWRSTPVGESTDVTEEDAGFCRQPVPDRDSGTASGVVQFSKDETTRLVETVVSYASVEEATAAFDQLEQLVESCKEWDVEVEGTVSRYRLSATSFPTLTDETLAVRVDGDFTVPPSEGVTRSVEGRVVADTVMARYQGVIVVIRHFAIGLGEAPQLNSTETEPIARRAVDKVMEAQTEA
jgi:hypothetical protein